MKKSGVLIAALMLNINAYADFIPQEAPIPSNPGIVQQTNTDPNASTNNTDLSSAEAWLISIPSTSTTASQQVHILRKGGLPAYSQTQGNQTLVLVGPELNKTNLLQEQKIVLELLDTAGTIVPYQVMS
ncbi:MAG: hypothetical protein Q7V63_05015 [Gammaproteobacteria bacterium]|nr:hypothetical protein [Gammaproteobacteria bacterium]